MAELTAQNESVAGFANMGTGLGMIGGMAMGVGGAVAGITGEALRPISNVPPQSVPPQQQIPAPTPATSSPENNSAAPSAEESPKDLPSKPVEGVKERMEKLNSIREFLPEEVYQAKLKEILESI